jgi:hypothetical protein
MLASKKNIKFNNFIMEQFTKSNCRICLSNDAPLYISINDDILNTKICDLIFEISNKKMCIDDGN